MGKNNKAILIVNDETAYADFLKRDIKGAFPSVRINTADSGESALMMIEECKYNVIIAEMMIPGMGGINLFLEIKKLFPDIRMILLSNHLNSREKKLLEKEGLFGYLEKPFLIESLAEMIVEAMGV
jgi:two-component system response regulator PilR (NtrC family)